MKNYRETFIKELDENSDVHKLLEEVEAVKNFPLLPYRKNSMIIHYLQDCILKRGSITKDNLDLIPHNNILLRKPLKKLHNSDIYFLCQSIAVLGQSGVEKNAGSMLYVFLNKYLKEPTKKKRKKSFEL